MKPPEFKATVEFVCPFCRKHAAVGDGEKVGVVHALPLCEKFETLGPVEFMKAVNREYARIARIP